jgi:pimeloyl-ACP methyl ester carboxylesterase
MVTPRTHGSIDIDGLPVYYETEGDEDTVVLLHGGLADNSTWAAQFSGLSPYRHVVAPERQAQGHTPDRTGPLTYQAMADQTVSVLVTLGLGRSTCWDGATGAWSGPSSRQSTPNSSGH